MKRPTNDALVARARTLYAQEGEIEFDDQPKVARGSGNPNGAYVAAWVWVELCDGGEGE